jgi:CRP/FNR family transcriptional regulator
MTDLRRRIAFPKGTVLFQPGQACPGLVLLDKGTIKVTLTAANGREVVLYRVSPGDMCLQTFSCLVEGRTYSAEGVAETDLEGELVPPDRFRTRLETDPAFRGLVFSAVANRFGEYERLIEDVALTGFDARLARVLLRLADGAGEVHASHNALAVETASGRAFVSRRMAEMARAGLVEQHRGGVRVLDRTGLERIAAEER